jgi:DNA integrity scanning protein DisA with diadenylate cyclase activity
MPKYDEIKTWTSRRGEYWNFDGKDNIPIEYSVADVNAEEALKRLSQLTALDGATIITKDFEVLAFGANLKPVNAKRRPDLILCRSPFRNIPEKDVRFEEIGGTRHKSACQFVYDQRESVAIVASQDGHVSVIYWDEEIKKLRALQNAEYLA